MIRVKLKYNIPLNFLTRNISYVTFLTDGEWPFLFCMKKDIRLNKYVYDTGIHVRTKNYSTWWADFESTEIWYVKSVLAYVFPYQMRQLKKKKHPSDSSNSCVKKKVVQLSIQDLQILLNDAVYDADCNCKKSKRIRKKNLDREKLKQWCCGDPRLLDRLRRDKLSLSGS